MNQRGLQDPGARRLGASARRKSTRRKSRRQKKNQTLALILEAIQQTTVVVEDPSLGNRGDKLMPMDSVLMKWEPLWLSTATRSNVRASNQHLPSLTHHNILYLNHIRLPLLFPFPSLLDVD